MRLSRSTDWSQITKYLLGDATPEEAAAAEQWITETPDRAAEFAILRQRWLSTLPLNPSLETNNEPAWEELQRTLKFEGAVLNGSRPLSRPQVRKGEALHSIGWRESLPRWLIRTGVERGISRFGVGALTIAVVLAFVGFKLLTGFSSAHHSAEFATYTTAPL